MIKSLTPFTKFLIFILTMVAALITNDTRFLGVLALIALTCFISAKLKFAKWLWILIILHLVITFSLDPDYAPIVIVELIYCSFKNLANINRIHFFRPCRWQ